MKINRSFVCFTALWFTWVIPCHAGKIHDAIAKRDLVAIELAVKQHPNEINSRCYPDFETPLSMAVAIGDPAMVKSLLNAGAKITIPDIGLVPIIPLQRAAFAPCNISIQGATPGDLQKQWQNLHDQNAKMRAALTDAEKAARLEVLALLLEKKPELNKDLPFGISPLQFAVGTGNTDAVKLLINSGANVNTRNDLWFTPLHMAALCKANRDTIEALITAGADVEAFDKKGNTPLYLAARYGSMTAVETLLSHHASADVEGEEQIPVIGAAALSGNDDIVKFIHEKSGSDLIRYANKLILFQSAARGGSKALTEILLTARVDVNIRDAAGYTPLLTASENGHWELSDYLIQKGANRKTKTNDGLCLFDFACLTGNTALAKEMLESNGWPQGCSNLLSKIIITGRVDILQLLVDRKVNILDIGQFFAESNVSPLLLSVTGLDQTIKDTAACRESLVATEEDYARTIELLLKQGADIHQMSRDGSTAVHLAAKYCGAKVMNALLKAGGKHSLPNSVSKATPLQIATLFGRTETVRALLDAGADRNIRDSDGQTLLHLAAMSGNSETLSLLINEKLPVNVITLKDKTTPLHYAALTNSLESVRLLLDAGAKPDVMDTTGFSPLAFAVSLKRSLDVFKNSAPKLIMINDLKNRLSIIHLLLQSGATTKMITFDTATGKECSFLEFAASNGTPEIVELLKNPPPIVKKIRKP